MSLIIFLFYVNNWSPYITIHSVSITIIIFFIESSVEAFLIEFHLIWWQNIHLVGVFPFSNCSMKLQLFLLEKSSFFSIHCGLHPIKFINRVLKIGIIQVLVLGNIQWARTGAWIYIRTHFMNFAYVCLFLYIVYSCVV